MSQRTQKLRAILTGLFFLFLSAFASYTYGAQAPTPQISAQERCDQLANNPDDPAKVGRGVAFDKIQVTRALPPCEKAARLTPTPTISTYMAGFSMLLNGTPTRSNSSNWEQPVATPLQ